MSDPLHDPDAATASPAPSTSSTLVSASPTSSTWHAVRPWAPPLSLAIREITSVSATFVLSAAAPLPIHHQSPDLSLDPDLELDELAQQEPSIISDALAKGLSVNVNGSPWQRVYIRIDDGPSDEAVIIIYGLMPGRQYDIDLGINHGRHFRRQVATEDPNLDPPSPSSQSAPVITPLTNNTSVATAPPPSQTTADPTANPPALPTITLEDRLAQLNHSLSILTSERESLQAQIKAVRRDGQKADAALRSEIDALKRASEKHMAAEARAKQKILALQEAAKRAQAGARATEEQLVELKAALPSLLKEKDQKEAEFQQVKKEAERARNERDSAVERDTKRLDKLRTELATLAHKLEKLNGKQERVERQVIPDLEEQLKQTRMELENLEKEEEALAIEELTSVVGQEYTFQGFSRRRANTGGSTPNPGPISRPQRTSDASFSPTLLGQHESQQVQRVPTLPQHRRSSLRSNSGGSVSFTYADQLQTAAPSSPSSSSSGSPVGPHPPGLVKNTSSTLSSRALAFEPPRNGPYVAPIQRPSGATVTRSKSGASTQSRHA